MSGLAHYIEAEGIPTTSISLVRKHSEEMKPPRALAVPFELGRPFGAPNEPDFQRRVLRAVLDLLERTDHESFCPFKGVASYWNLDAAGRSEANVVWSYEDPFDQVAGLKDYVAFYPDRVELREGA